MLVISTDQLSVLENKTWDTWVVTHANALADLLPDIAANYDITSWRQLIDSLLRRADLHGMTLECETVAYCYGSIVLGIGFESYPDLPWTGMALSARGEARAEALWDGFESSASNKISEAN